MKHLLAILLLALLVPLRASAQFFPLTNEVDMALDSSSFGLDPYVMWQRYFTGYFDGMNPAVTNHLPDVGESGSALQFDWQRNWPKWLLPHALHFPIPFWVMAQATDNGAYTSNDVITWMTNMVAAPPIWWNGTAKTNHGLSFQPMSFLAHGGVPIASTDQTRPQHWEDAGTNVAAIAGTTPIRVFSRLISLHAFTNLTFWGPGHDHPSPPQALEMAVYTLLELNVETNVGTLTYDWGAAKAYTNHWASSGPSVTGNVLTDTIRPTRMPPGFDVPDGYITNDCRPAFTNIPTLGDSFHWPLQVTNLPAGNYVVAFNGSAVITLTDIQLAAGWNQWTNYSGPFWQAMTAIQTNICVEYGVDPVTLSSTHNAGEGNFRGVLDLINFQSQGTGFYDAGNITGFITQMANAVNGMDTNAAFTHASSQPPTVTLTITRQVNNLNVGTLNVYR